MKLKKQKRVIAMALTIMVLVTLVACQPTPEKPFINGNSDGDLNTPQATFSNAETPKTVTETIQKGNLSLDIDAEVLLPDNEDFYLYPAGNFDFSSEEFQKKAVSVFFGADNTSKVEANKKENEGYYRYTQKIDNGESSLTIESQKQVVSFISYMLHSNVDTSEANKYAENETIDIGMVETQAIELAQNNVDGLGFEGYKPGFVGAFGKLDDHQRDFYEIVFSRNVDSTEVLNVNARYRSQDSSPLDDKIIVTIGEGGLWMLGMCVTELSQKTDKVSVVSFEDALADFKQSGIAKLSATLSQGTKYTVTKIQLAYVYAQSENTAQDLMLIPAWVFFCKGEEKLDNGETFTFFINIAVDGITGKVLN